MSSILHAVRAFEKVWLPLSDELDAAADLDAAFDGGEFSGPLHAEYHENLYEDTLKSVAYRFDIDERELHDLYHERQHVHSHPWN